MACKTCGTCTPTVVVPTPELGDKITAPVLGVVTEEVVTGKGVFDIYMRAAKAQLDEEYKKTRIKGADYAIACVQLIDKMMMQANQFVISEFSTKLDAQMKTQMFPYQMASLRYDTALKEATVGEMMAKSELTCTQTTELVMNGAKDRDLKTSQIAVQGAQKDLYVRQTKGFDDKRDNDNLKIVTDSWAVQATEMNEAGTSIMNILDVNGNGTLNNKLTSVL
ncbi:MAG: hypothetical protein DRQ78_06070 [Epsilonproteobacteria bacterium]|nr:MAG: hypothetical protein DRQ78_06070 [Campylobacterota bacterium]